MTDILTLNELFDMEMAQLEQERGRVPDPDSWRWSPSDIRVWDTMLNIAHQHFTIDIEPRKTDPISIWEAGSGIGTKLYRAKHHYGMIEYGFERFDYYIAAAKRLGVACEQRDLSDLDNQPDWSIPDIVFTARPFKNNEFEYEWEDLVHKRMHDGAVLISTFTAKKPYNWITLYRATFRGVWVKPGTPSTLEPDTIEMRKTETTVR